tara:strand:+ start:133 stop:477 length:345 start_codon:yes stop_codon:yes gene_type:complete
MGKHRTAAEKQEFVEKYRASGLIKRDFCRQQGISENSLYAALKEYAPELLSRNNQHTQHKDKTKFIPVISNSTPIPTNRDHHRFVLFVADGLKMEFPAGFNVSYLKELIGMLAR